MPPYSTRQRGVWDEVADTVARLTTEPPGLRTWLLPGLFISLFVLGVLCGFGLRGLVGF